MADRERERVGRIGGIEGLLYLKDGTDHGLNLILARVADPDARFLDLGRRVFEDRHTALGRGEQRDTRRLTDPDRGPRIGVEEQALDRDRIWLILLHDALEREAKIHEL